MGNRFGITAVMVFVLFLFASCATTDVEKAFSSGTGGEKSNKIIIKYCTSCHPHKSFNAVTHVPAAQERYTGSPNAAATECRVCHTYSISWMGDEVRGTHWIGVKEP